MPTAGGVWRAIERGATIGCEIVQLFVKNNRQWFGQPCSDEELRRYQQQMAAARLHLVFGHAGYLINLAAPASANRDRSIRSLIQEVEIAQTLDLPFLVLHPGSHLGAGEAAGIQQAVAGLDEVLRATRRTSVRIALETTAGQGTCLGHRLSHLAEIYQRVATPRRLGICVDTAHLFAAGYDWRQPQAWDALLQEIDSRVGLAEIRAFHLNDSKADFNSRVDRHAGIGQGKIGQAPFIHLLKDPRFRDHPGCLETPKSPDLHEDIENLAILRALEASGPGEIEIPFAKERLWE
jgi:deoxyribonuclease IV